MGETKRTDTIRIAFFSVPGILLEPLPRFARQLGVELMGVPITTENFAERCRAVVAGGVAAVLVRPAQYSQALELHLPVPVVN